MKKRFYILFVSTDENGEPRKVALPMRYVSGFMIAAVVGAFTIVGLAGSYTRMLLKTESYNQIRQDNTKLRQDYAQMAQIAHDRDVQVASLGALANEVTALYGLRQSKLQTPEAKAEVTAGAAASQPKDGQAETKQFRASFDELYSLRSAALSGQVSRALESGLTPDFKGDWTALADAPTLWPVEGRVTSSFGERQDPFNGEGAFHAGVDIGAEIGTPVRAAADGTVTAAEEVAGYGRQVILDHGHDLNTLYGHMSAIAVMSGEQVKRGQIIGYVGSTGRSTGPHLHYEVRLHGAPINPHPYLRKTYTELSQGNAAAKAGM